MVDSEFFRIVKGFEDNLAERGIDGHWNDDGHLVLDGRFIEVSDLTKCLMNKITGKIGVLIGERWVPDMDSYLKKGKMLPTFRVICYNKEDILRKMKLLLGAYDMYTGALDKLATFALEKE